MMRWWERLIILLCLAADQIISVNHSHIVSRPSRNILAVDQDSGIRSEASFGISSIFGAGTRSDIGSSVNNILNGGSGGILGLFGGSNNQANNGNSVPPQPDSGYLVVKVDLLSSDSTNISAVIQPLMTEVEKLLETGLLRGTFKLTWVSYDHV